MKIIPPAGGNCLTDSSAIHALSAITMKMLIKYIDFLQRILGFKYCNRILPKSAQHTFKICNFLSHKLNFVGGPILLQWNFP